MSDPPALPRPSRFWMTWRILQVRLRFVAVLLAAFALMGGWPWLRRGFDDLWHQFTSSRTAEHGVSDDTEYFCPMDPGVLSNWPAICPICKMDLVRRRKGEMTLLPDGVLARMQFSPYRIQLAGIQTSLVSPQTLSQPLRLGGRVIALTEPSTPGSPLPGDSVRVACPMFARDAVRLRPGLPVQITVEGDSQARSGQIDEVPDSPPAGVREVTLRVRFDAPPPREIVGQFARVELAIPYNPEGVDTPILAIPDTAVVELGDQRIVYVESMPGMFDAVPVTLGPRCGSWQPVLEGLTGGEKVATTGVFLIDAEARLNPAVGAAYFGSARSRGPASAEPSLAVPRVQAKALKRKGAPLTAAQRAQAAAQKTCPVTDADLDSMGGPVLIEVQGRTVFLCCQGCETAVRDAPEKFFAKLPPPR